LTTDIRAYRRTCRALEAKGLSSRNVQPQALDAAYAEFVRLTPEAANWTTVEVSARVNPMIAVAISAKAECFWHRP
jgi:hypothetical protein